MNESTEVIFSDKYEPLFFILQCWDEVDRLSRIGITESELSQLEILLNNTDRTAKEEIELYQIRFKGLNESEKQELQYNIELSQIDTVLISGGRDSGKTFATTTFNTIATADYNHRILFTRQTMSSTDNSITQALENRMEMLGLRDEFDYANHDYTLKDGREGKISITGQKTQSGNQTAKLKSLENYSIFETDEAEELVSYEDWVKIKRSLRAKDVQCLAILIFNPPTREHWIAEEFYQSVPDGFNGIKGRTLYIHTTYLDNGKENMAEHNWREYQELKAIHDLYANTPKDDRLLLDPKIKKSYEKYKYNILGGFKKQEDGVIYEDWEFGEFDESLGHINGLDFGSNDPDACTKVAIDHSKMKIYLQERFFQNGLSTEQLKGYLKKTVGYDELIIADAAGKRSIRDLWDDGFEIEKCYKGKVEEEIKMLKSYTLVVCPNSLNLHKALNNYRWSDRKGSVPHHDWSDLCDSFRYAAMYLLRGSGSRIL